MYSSGIQSSDNWIFTLFYTRDSEDLLAQLEKKEEVENRYVY